MTKGILILILILLAILVGGCSQTDISARRDIKENLGNDSVISKNDVKNNLSEIEEAYDNLDYESVINLYAKKLPKNMSVTKFKYFVIFSDLGESLTYRLIDSDVRNTIDAMENTYVSKKPDNATPLILFNDFDAYKSFVLKNYDIREDDLSPYGFYKISKNVIVVRYVSWKGSIMHEITHKFTKTDFPDMPSWFDEGLASLHEKSTYKKGELIGDFSFRIIPLRRALKEETYTGLEVMMSTNDEQLYGKRSSYYYAQSRYLLMYLQEKGLLKDYYTSFKETYKKDKTGISQLEKTLGKSLAIIDEDYLEYIKSFKQ